MGGYKFDYEKKVWGGEQLRLSPIHFRASRLFYALKALKDIKGKLLDVGCGVGDIPEAITHYCPDLKVYGIDISERAIGIAKKRVRKVTFKVADVQNLPFKDESFDVVTCFDLIEHVEDSQKALIEIYRVLKSRGVFHTFIPTEAELLSLEGPLIKLGWKGKEIYGGHPHHFSKKQVLDWINNAGFDVKKLRWGEHLVNQMLEIGYFSYLAIRGKNLESTVEGYLANAKPSILTNSLKLIKNILATLSYFETRIFWWFPGLGVHLTCQKK